MTTGTATSEARQGLTCCSDLLSLQRLLGGHGVWTPELEKELVEWANARPRETICAKCGLREQKGDQVVAQDRLVRHRHGWRSTCIPLTKTDLWTYKTFSVSFFRIVPKSSGKGTKAESIGYRLSGPCLHRDDVVKRANEIVAALDAGWVPPKKSEKFRPNTEA
jgi:hypothetical protein